MLKRGGIKGLGGGGGINGLKRTIVKPKIGGLGGAGLLQKNTVAAAPEPQKDESDPITPPPKEEEAPPQKAPPAPKPLFKKFQPPKQAQLAAKPVNEKFQPPKLTS